MKLSYMDILGDQKRHTVTATVTTNHPDSSYGQPVIILESDHKALDITSWILLNYQIVEATPEEMELLKRVLIVDPRFTAAALGSRGGSANTPAQNAARAANAKHAGRRKGSKNKPKGKQS